VFGAQVCATPGAASGNSSWLDAPSRAIQQTFADQDILQQLRSERTTQDRDDSFIPSFGSTFFFTNQEVFENADQGSLSKHCFITKQPKCASFHDLLSGCSTLDIHIL
jgi:hypothetical protein